MAIIQATNTATTSPAPKSYADVMARKKPAVQIAMDLYRIKKTGDDAKEIQETLTKILDPIMYRIKVKGMKPARETVIVETNTENGC